MIAVNPQIKSLQTESLESRAPPMDLGMPPLTIKDMFESNPQISRFLLRDLAIGMNYVTKQQVLITIPPP